MDTAITKEKDGKVFNRFNQEIIKCKLCGGPTTMTGTELCDKCWEFQRLKKTMNADFDMTLKVMSELFMEKTMETKQGYKPDKEDSTADFVKKKRHTEKSLNPYKKTI